MPTHERSYGFGVKRGVRRESGQSVSASVTPVVSVSVSAEVSVRARVGVKVRQMKVKVKGGWWVMVGGW
jgi:hypothetical protein